MKRSRPPINSLKKTWDIEVVDLRSAKPIDTDTVLASVAPDGTDPCASHKSRSPWGGLNAEVIAGVVASRLPPLGCAPSPP